MFEALAHYQFKTVGGLIKETPGEGVERMLKIIIRIGVLTIIILLALSNTAA